LALQYLTHPSLIPTFADEILDVLVRASSNDLTLPLAYYHTIQPTLASSRATECLFSALARTSVTEAFYFCRGLAEYTHRHMFEMLVSLVLNNSPSDTIADRCVELVNLPLSTEGRVAGGLLAARRGPRVEEGQGHDDDAQNWYWELCRVISAKGHQQSSHWGPGLEDAV